MHAKPASIANTALLALGGLAAASAHATDTCSVRSAATAAPVVELYTSEGCSSCPPADRWLSRLKADPSVVALAFHVDYWDRLGWADRFASDRYTQRQAQQQASSGARFSYTPQVLLDGADRPDWSTVPVDMARRPRPAAPVDVTLTRDGAHFSATVSPSTGAPKRLSAYWAVTEQGHVSVVNAGENSGATLRHDFVVRAYQPVAAWSMQPGGPTLLTFDDATARATAHPREVNLVIVNADTGRPVQAVKLGC